MARWNQQPKYHIKNWSAYGYLQAQTHAVRSTFKRANDAMNTEALVRITIKDIQRMSPAVKTTITDQYKYAVFLTKVYLMQLDGKRVQVK